MNARFAFFALLSACAPAVQWAKVSALPKRTMPGGKAGLVAIEDEIGVHFDATDRLFQTTFEEHMLLEITSRAGIDAASLRLPAGTSLDRARVIDKDGAFTLVRNADTLADKDGTTIRFPNVSVGSRIEIFASFWKPKVLYRLNEQISKSWPVEHFHLDLSFSDSISAELFAHNASEHPRLTRVDDIAHATLDLYQLPAADTAAFRPPWRLEEPWWSYRVTHIATHRYWDHGQGDWNHAFYSTALKINEWTRLSQPLVRPRGPSTRERIDKALAQVQKETELSGFAAKLSGAKVDTIVSNGVANNFEKALLLQRRLSDAGVQAELAFTGRDRGITFDTPEPENYDHMLVWIPAQIDLAQPMFVDPSCEACRAGELPDWSQHRDAAVMRPHGAVDGDQQLPEIHFEKIVGDPSAAARRTHVSDATLSADGSLTAHDAYALDGSLAVDAMLSERKSPTPRGVISAHLGSLPATAKAASVTRLECHKDDAHCETHVAFTVPAFATETSDHWIVPMPLTKQRALESALEGRRSDLYFAQEETSEERITLHLPAGYKVAVLPEGVVAESEAVSLRVSFESKGSDVIIERTLVQHEGRFKKDDYRAALPGLARLNELAGEVLTIARAK